MADPSKPPARESRSLPTSYEVPAPSARQIREVERAAVPLARPPVYAVFVAHGMGQQIPFETLDQIAQGLRREDSLQPGSGSEDPPNPKVSNVKIGEERLQRIELKLSLPGGGEREVHIYEGYWAPLTEGQVSLREVMAFLFSAAWNGIQNGSREFRRWLFGEYRSFATPVRIVLYLLTALAVAASLVVVNTAIVTVAAARSALVQTPAWLSDGLFADLSTTFNFLLLAAGAFLAGLVLSRWRRGSRWLGWLTAALFVLTLFTIAATGIAIPALLYLHLKSGDPAWEFWAHGRPGIVTFDRYFEFGLLALLAAGVAVLLGLLVWRIVAARMDDMAEAKEGHLMSRIAWIVFTGLTLGLLAEVVTFALAARALPGMNTLHILRRGVSWPLLVLLSAYVRQFLIQYAGDVAIYVTPHRLDRFNELRNRIRTLVLEKARAVYTAKVGGARYDKVMLVGHSLGSVIVYDALDQLIADDESAQEKEEKGLDADARTGLLLTFGSPLDKTAFLFAVQGNRTSEAREALAASVQPLLVAKALRGFPWVNVWSPWDLFSGHLKFYDPQKSGSPPSVENVVDENATTLIWAHTEYWNNREIYKILHEKLRG